MIVRQLLAWARSAPPDHRAEAAAGLAGAYLGGELSSAERRDAETALMAMLDDPSPAVRRTLAEALADSPEAPRPVIIALANDGGAVAEAVLARSPVLADADLIDCAALGDEPVQTAIARRPYVSVATAGALAEIAGPAPWRRSPPIPARRSPGAACRAWSSGTAPIPASGRPCCAARTCPSTFVTR